MRNTNVRTLFCADTSNPSLEPCITNCQCNDITLTEILFNPLLLLKAINPPKPIQLLDIYRKLDFLLAALG